MMYQLNDTHSSRFLVTSRDAFKAFNKVMLFKMNVERMVIPPTNDNKINRSWYSAEAEDVFEIAETFDKMAKDVFSDPKILQSTHIGNDDVLAVEFRLMQFNPTASRHGSMDDDTIVDTSYNSFGIASIQAVLAHSQTGELIAVIEDKINLSTIIAGSYAFSRNTKQNQMLAWRRAFKNWLQHLHQDLQKLRSEALTKS
ncbi:hypothetical protein QX776_09950 [Alteromonadaceae bacterium BrNp21-10]|nr:hypothetical protein [Alteromonadaceae bacterium BrNp21-10]